MKARRITLGLAIAYFAMLLAAWAFIAFDTGQLWFVTLFLFSPRWVLALPLLILVPLTLIIRARQLPLYVLHTLVIVFPLLGFQFRWTPPPKKTVDLRVMSCNLGGGQIHVASIVRRVEQQQIDLLMLQECPTSISVPLFEQLGWYHQQQDNIAIGSRFELSDSLVLARQPRSHHQIAAAVQCELYWQPSSTNDVSGQFATVVDGRHRIQLVCLHLPTFRPALEQAKRFESGTGSSIQKMAGYYRQTATELRQEVSYLARPVLLAGDFNVPVDSAHYRDFWKPFHNAIDQAGFGLAYTKYTRFHGVRIDHVLYRDDLQAVNAWADQGFGGDHRPVVVDLVLQRGRS